MKDRLKGEDIVVTHCPTLQMIGDFFTKPLQGNLFHKFRDVILGHAHVDTLALDQHLPIEEAACWRRWIKRYWTIWLRYRRSLGWPQQ